MTQPHLARFSELWDALNDLKNILDLSGQSILNSSGRFLYSEVSTLKKGDFYLLGYNPGGNPLKETKTFLEDINTWGPSSEPNQSTKSYNAYLDEKWPPWSGELPGNSHFQRNVKNLCKAIDICPRKVCTSNLFFIRSEDATSHDNKWLGNEYKSVHWRVHKEIIEIVKPSYVIAIGRNTYNIIKQFLGFKDKDLFPSGVYNRGKECYCYVADGKYQYRDEKEMRGMRLIGLPHFKFCYPGLEVKESVWDWIKEQSHDFD